MLRGNSWLEGSKVCWKEKAWTRSRSKIINRKTGARSLREDWGEMKTQEPITWAILRTFNPVLNDKGATKCSKQRIDTKKIAFLQIYSGLWSVKYLGRVQTLLEDQQRGHRRRENSDLNQGRNNGYGKTWE